MKILKFKTNSQLDKSIATVIDFYLKSNGIEGYGHVNFILNSIQNLPEEQVVAPEVVASEVVASEVKPEAETQLEPVVETQS